MRIHRVALSMSVAYLIESERGIVLVDAGIRREDGRILAALRRLGRSDLRLIYITHAHLDHYGSAAAIRWQTGAPIAVHQADSEAIAAGETRLGQAQGRGLLLRALLPLFNPLLHAEPVMADVLLDDGQRLDEFGLGGSVLHTPGHTPGSTCLLLDGQIAFSGDLVTTAGGPHVQRSFAADWAQIPDSVRKLQMANPSWVYPGHGRRRLSGARLQELA